MELNVTTQGGFGICLVVQVKLDRIEHNYIEIFILSRREDISCKIIFIIIDILLKVFLCGFDTIIV